MAHTYLFGLPQTGKTELMYLYIRKAIKAGDGVFVVDSNGELIDKLIHQIPKSRRKDVILFDPSQEEFLGFNPLENTANIPLIVSILLDTIKAAWGYDKMPTPVMDMYLYFGLSALAERKRTLADLPDLLSDKDYRTELVSYLKDEVVQKFWVNFDTMTTKEQRAEVASTLNKALMLIADPRIRRTFATQQSSFSCADVVSSNKIFLARLPQGQLSIGRTKLTGSVLLSLMHQACLLRVNTTPFHFFLDDCHLWAPSVVKEMLSSAGKFNVNIVLAHQYIDQLDPDYYAAILGSCEKMIFFRTSMDDARRIKERFGPNNISLDFTELPPFHARQSPFRATSPDVHVAYFDKEPYPRSWADIQANHKLTLYK